mgnify:CR=1 FL=1
MTGDKLTQDAYHGCISDQFLHNYEWPRAPPSLPPKFWNLWKQALTKCFLQAVTNQNNLALVTPLGNWVQDPSEHWSWFYQLSNGDLYHSTDDGAFRHTTGTATHAASTAAVHLPGAWRNFAPNVNQD